MKTILVTGASGYIAKQCIVELIQQGYNVKGTVRDLTKAEVVKQDLEAYLNKTIDIEFFEADLTNDSGWDDAMKGCDAVMHTASPFPLKPPKNPNDVLEPACEGTMRVLKAAQSQQVNRIVLTSSTVAIWFGNFEKLDYDESVWSNINHPSIDAYTKSKTVAEKTAWDFCNQNNIQMTSLNPVAVWGPGIGNHLASTSLTYVKMLVNKEMPMVPRMKVPLVDVRDVAKMHVSALKTDESIGKRFILSENEYWMIDIASQLNSLGYDAPKKEAPNFLMKIIAIFDQSMKITLPFLGLDYNLNTEQARQVLGFKPISNEQTLKDSVTYVKSLM